MSRPTSPSPLARPLTAEAGEPDFAAGHARAAPAPHPVAPRARVRADTAPLPAPGATFETRRLVAVGGERLELVRTWQERAFLGVFVGFAAALAAIGASRFGTEAVGDALAAVPAASPVVPLDVPLALPLAWPPILAAAALALVAVAAARAGGRTVLDGRTRQFSRSGGLPRFGDRRSAAGGRALGGRRPLDRVDFDELVGVQRLACRLADEEVSWTIHQVNLVMRDGQRVHVCSHVEEALARRTAETVARFVGVDVLASSGGGGNAAR